MADIGSTGTYLISITVSTNSGDLPKPDEFASMLDDTLDGYVGGFMEVLAVVAASSVIDVD